MKASVDDDDELDEYAGYSAAFAKLHNAALREPELISGLQPPGKFLADSLAQLSKVFAQLLLFGSSSHILREQFFPYPRVSYSQTAN